MSLIALLSSNRLIITPQVKERNNNVLAAMNLHGPSFLPSSLSHSLIHSLTHSLTHSLFIIPVIIPVLLSIFHGIV
jgi:hypothetical protein